MVPAGWYTADLPPKTGTYRPFLPFASAARAAKTGIKLSSGGTLATYLRPKTRYCSHNSHDKARNSGVSRSAAAEEGRSRSTAVDDAVRQLADDMLETMYAAKGVGLAATQVDVHKRLIVLDVSEERDQPLVLINPEILSCRGLAVRAKRDACPCPGIYDKLQRATHIRVRALDRNGEPFEMDADGLARGLHPARDGSSRRQAVRRLPIRAQAPADSAAPGKGAQAAIRGERNSRSAASRARLWRSTRLFEP